MSYIFIVALEFLLAFCGVAMLPLLIGWLLDLLLGDPAWMPHPVVGFGKMIASGEVREVFLAVDRSLEEGRKQVERPGDTDDAVCPHGGDGQEQDRLS